MAEQTRKEMGPGGYYVDKPAAIARPMKDGSGLWEVYLPGEGVWSNHHTEAAARRAADNFNSPI
jgi:hypothetical protein